MKKLFVGFILIGVGAASWWLLSQTARFSIKKWDAKFGSTLRQQLNEFGLSNLDILSSINEVKKDNGGEWIVHRLSVKLPDASKQKTLKEKLEESGAVVVEKILDDKTVLFVVTRGERTYQEIKFIKP